MGVHHLWSILEPVKQVCPIEEIANKRLCIDLSYWVCQLANVSYESPLNRPYLRGLFHRVRFLIGLNCSVIFVADGQVPAIKLPAYHQRLELPAGHFRPPLHAKPIEENAEAGKRYKTSEFGRMVEEAKALGRALGIPVITSPEEAEAQCALLNATALADICCTGDSDAFLFGAKLVMKDMTLKPGQNSCTLYSADDIKQSLGYGRNSLIALGVLLGSDYSPKFSGFSTRKATSLILAANDETVLADIEGTGVRQLAAKVKPPKSKSKKTAKSKTAQSSAAEDGENGGPPQSDEQKLALQCIQAYLQPKCHGATSTYVQRILAEETTVHLEALRKLLKDLLDWEEDVTDRYILPKLAERDVRRKAQIEQRKALAPGDGQSEALRAVEEGLQYRVAELLKVLVHYQQPFYRVAWAGVPPLDHCPVPAGIVDMAYPEVVAVFQTEQARKAASKTRPKKGKSKKLPVQEAPAVNERAPKPQTELRDAEESKTINAYDWADSDSEFPDLQSRLDKLSLDKTRSLLEEDSLRIVGSVRSQGKQVTSGSGTLQDTVLSWKESSKASDMGMSVVGDGVTRGASGSEQSRAGEKGRVIKSTGLGRTKKEKVSDYGKLFDDSSSSEVETWERNVGARRLPGVHGGNQSRICISAFEPATGESGGRAVPSSAASEEKGQGPSYAGSECGAGVYALPGEEGSKRGCGRPMLGTLHAYPFECLSTGSRRISAEQQRKSCGEGIIHSRKEDKAGLAIDWSSNGKTNHRLQKWSSESSSSDSEAGSGGKDGQRFAGSSSRTMPGADLKVVRRLKHQAGLDSYFNKIPGGEHPPAGECLSRLSDDMRSRSGGMREGEGHCRSEPLHLHGEVREDGPAKPAHTRHAGQSLAGRTTSKSTIPHGPISVIDLVSPSPAKTRNRSGHESDRLCRGPADHVFLMDAENSGCEVGPVSISGPSQDLLNMESPPDSPLSSDSDIHSSDQEHFERVKALRNFLASLRVKSPAKDSLYKL